MAAVHAIDAHLAARDLQGLFDMERHLRAFRDFPRPFLGVREDRHSSAPDSILCFIFSLPQSHIASMIEDRLRPNSVRLYSVRGGTTG